MKVFFHLKKLLRRFNETSKGIRVIYILIFCLIYGTIGFYLIEGHSWLESIYWTFSVITTVGFGDYVPVSNLGRIFTISVMIFGIGTFFCAIDAGVDFMTKKEEKKRLGLIPIKEREHIVICGLTKSTRQAIKQAEEKKLRHIFVMDPDETVRTEAISIGINYVYGDPTRLEDLEKLNLKEAKAVIVDLPTDSQAMHCILGIRHLNPDVRIIANVEREENITQIQNAGANQIISSSLLLGKLLWRSIDSIYQASFVQGVLATSALSQIAELKITSKSKLIGTTLKEAKIYQTTGVIVIGIGQQENLIIDPSPDFILNEEDILLCLGTIEEIEKLKEIV